MNNLEKLKPIAEKYNRSADGIMDRVISLCEKVKEKMDVRSGSLMFLKLYDEDSVLGNIVSMTSLYRMGNLTIDKAYESGGSIRMNFRSTYAGGKKKARDISTSAIPVELMVLDVDEAADAVYKRYLGKELDRINTAILKNEKAISDLERDNLKLEEEFNEILQKCDPGADI